MELKGTHNGHEVVFNTHRQMYESASLEKRFSTHGELEKALDNLDLAARKDFTNRDAYIISGWRGDGNDVIAVKVVLTDGNSAWVETETGRKKLPRNTIYASKHEVDEYLLLKADEAAVVRCAFKNLTPWAPVKGSSEPDRVSCDAKPWYPDDRPGWTESADFTLPDDANAVVETMTRLEREKKSYDRQSFASDDLDIEDPDCVAYIWANK